MNSLKVDNRTVTDPVDGINGVMVSNDLVFKAVAASLSYALGSDVEVAALKRDDRMQCGQMSHEIPLQWEVVLKK